jgi:hypothetical protein
MYAIDAVLDLYFPVEDKDELQGMADRFSERWGQGEMNGTVLAIDGACAYACACACAFKQRCIVVLSNAVL